MTAFLAGVDAIYADRNMAADASWRVGGTGSPIAARVLMRKPDAVVGFGDTRITTVTVLIHVRASEVASPRENDTVTVGCDVYRLMGKPERDSLGATWRCEARKV